MKKKMFKKSFWKNCFSVAIFGGFVFLGVASIDNNFSTKTHVSYDRYETIHYMPSGTIKTKGSMDDKERWQGPVTIVSTNLGGDYSVIEEVNMINGNRDGESRTLWQDGTISTTTYNNGWETLKKKSASGSSDAVSAFEILSSKYSFFKNQLFALGFLNQHVQSCMDTLELLLNKNDFELADFGDYYQNAVDDLSGTNYDSLLYTNSLMSAFRGLDRLKASEFRMAVIDRYRADEKSTFSSVTTNYPNYLLTLNDAGVNNPDFEIFCHSFDSVLTSFGDYNTEDPFFLDSLDNRMYRAMEIISTDEKSVSTVMLSAKSLLLTEENKKFKSLFSLVNPMVSKLLLKSNSKDVAAVIMGFMMLEFPKADLINQAIKEAWLNKMGIAKAPIVTTEFSNNISASSVSINSYFIEDGGVEILSKGIVWATYYNPTLNDQTINSGIGAEDFTTSIQELIPGQTYYTRTFATNSAGTSYGNCISFKAGSTVVSKRIEKKESEFIIFPNPASKIATFKFQIESSENLMLTIVNVMGQMVIKKDLGKLPHGENQIQLNLSDLTNGNYNCVLSNNSGIKISRQFIITQ